MLWDKEPYEPCFLCGEEAYVQQDTGDMGTIYYRFFNDLEGRWSSEAICPKCFKKLKGK